MLVCLCSDIRVTGSDETLLTGVYISSTSKLPSLQQAMQLESLLLLQVYLEDVQASGAGQKPHKASTTSPRSGRKGGEQMVNSNQMHGQQAVSKEDRRLTCDGNTRTQQCKGGT